jgi:hypothetical protein
MAAQYGVGQSVRGSRVRTVATSVCRPGASAGLERIGRMRLCVCVQQDSRTLFVVTIRLRNNISDLAPAPPVRGRGSPRRSLTGVRSHFFHWAIVDCVASGRRAPRTVPAQNRRQNG